MTDLQNRVIKRSREKISRFTKNKYNPKHHPKIQKDRLQAVLEKFGQVGEIYVWQSERNGGDWTIFDGHARQELDADQEWDIAWTSLTDPEVDELVLYYDPLAALARQESDKTMALMAGLKVQECELREMLQEQAQSLGFTFGGNGGGDMTDEGEVVIDRAEELQKVWQVSVGDVWQIGAHYLACGDCREPETWKRLLSAAGAKRANGVFTSPPYAMQRAKQYGGVPVGEYVSWWEAVQANVKKNLARDGSFFLNIKPHCEDGQRVLYVFDLVLAMVRKWGWRFVDELCWLRVAIPKRVYHHFKNGFEPVYQFSMSDDFRIRPRGVSHYSDDVPQGGGGVMSEQQGTGLAGRDFTKAPGLAYPSNVLDFKHGAGAEGHAAAFPAALPNFFIKAYSDPGDAWLDPFAGSGTVLASCHKNERRGLGIELLPKYCAVILERLQNLGLEPKRVGQA